MNVNTLAVTIVAGVITVVSFICITALLINSVVVPDAFYGILASSAGAAVLGGAVTQGAAIAHRGE